MKQREPFIGGTGWGAAGDCKAPQKGKLEGFLWNCLGVGHLGGCRVWGLERAPPRRKGNRRFFSGTRKTAQKLLLGRKIVPGPVPSWVDVMVEIIKPQAGKIYQSPPFPLFSSFLLLFIFGVSRKSRLPSNS